MIPGWSSTLYWTCITLSAGLSLYLLRGIFSWLQSFLYLRRRLPSSAASKSIWNFLGDLSLANTSQRHRWNTAATEALGPVFYIRALWMQVRIVQGTANSLVSSALLIPTNCRRTHTQAIAVADPFICREVLHSSELDKRPNTGYWIVTEVCATWSCWMEPLQDCNFSQTG